MTEEEEPVRVGLPPYERGELPVYVAPVHRATAAEIALLVRTMEATGGRTDIIYGEVLALLPGDIPDGVHDLHIDRAEAYAGGKLRVHVSDASGATAEIPLGQGERLARSLRLLLGSHGLHTVEEAVAALDGRDVRVRLTTYVVQRREFRGIERA